MKYSQNNLDDIGVYAASLKLDVYDTWGNLSVHGAAGFMNINKSAWGNMTVSGLAGATNLQHTGRTGNICW
jgi:RTX toxin RtxA